MIRSLLLGAGLTLLAGAADAQTWVQPRPGASDFDRHRYQADRHRAAMDDLRRGADLRDVQAARVHDDARSAVAITQSQRPAPLPYPGSRQPAPTAPVRPDGGFPTPGPIGSVDQIDAWLSRPF